MTTTAALADEPGRQKPSRSKSTSKLRDGVMKRGRSWSYVIRVPDPSTGASKPKWVGVQTEEAAKAARDEARIHARRGQYVNRSVSTVANYLAEWLETHAATVKPKTLAGYRHDIEHYIVPHIGRMRLLDKRKRQISPQLVSYIRIGALAIAANVDKLGGGPELAGRYIDIASGITALECRASRGTLPTETITLVRA